MRLMGLWTRGAGDQVAREGGEPNPGVVRGPPEEREERSGGEAESSDTTSEIRSRSLEALPLRVGNAGTVLKGKKGVIGNNFQAFFTVWVSLFLNPENIFLYFVR